MTKAELLRILEPFTDDIQIRVKSIYDSDIIVPANAEYKMATGFTIADPPIDAGEGYILIE